MVAAAAAVACVIAASRQTFWSSRLCSRRGPRPSENKDDAGADCVSRIGVPIDAVRLRFGMPADGLLSGVPGLPPRLASVPCRVGLLSGLLSGLLPWLEW